MTPETLQAAILNPDTMIQLCQQLKNEQEKNRELSVTNSRLTVENQIMQPKAEYFDELVDRNLLTNFRETAKELECKPKKFVEFLIERKYIYRDKRGPMRTRTTGCLSFGSASMRRPSGAAHRRWSRPRAGRPSDFCWYDICSHEQEVKRNDTI